MTHIGIHKLTRLAASGQILTVPGRVFGVLLFGGTAASSLKLTDDLNGAGVAVLNVNAPIGTTAFIDLANLGPAMFSVAVYGTLAGAGAEAYIWFE